WTATLQTDPGMTAEQVQNALQQWMDDITITPPSNFNQNHVDGGSDAFAFDALLTSSAAGGESNSWKSIKPTVGVIPVTDSANISIALDPAGTGDELNESDREIHFRVNVANPADAEYGSIIDGKLYLRVSSNELG